jgi:hypothetical protein
VDPQGELQLFPAAVMYLLEASLIPNGLAQLRLALEQYIKFLAGKEVLLLDLQTQGALHQVETPLT